MGIIDSISCIYDCPDSVEAYAERLTDQDVTSVEVDSFRSINASPLQGVSTEIRYGVEVKAPDASWGSRTYRETADSLVIHHSCKPFDHDETAYQEEADELKQEFRYVFLSNGFEVID